MLSGAWDCLAAFAVLAYVPSAKLVTIEYEELYCITKSAMHVIFQSQRYAKTQPT